MHTMNEAGNYFAKPDTITYNVVINAWAKSGDQGAALETERLLTRMHQLHQAGDKDIKPNVVTYGAVIDSYAKSGEKGAAAKADTLLAEMIQLYQSDPVANSDLQPNTYVFNTGTFPMVPSA
jgi:Pentatricopeptide repeat domain